MGAGSWLLWLLIGCSTGAGATGNLSNFASAGEAAVDYTRPITRAPATRCAQLARAGRDAFEVSSAAIVEAEGSAPAFCRVVGLIPRAVRFVVEMPLEWNGRLYMHGNGGDAGEPLDHPPYVRLRRHALARGFAAAYTDTGHDAATEPGATWAFQQPDKERDHGHRAVHETVTAAKALIQSFYAAHVRHSYFDGCSTGGRQGLMAAQRYPEDFDGVLGGAPVMEPTRMLWQYWKNQKAIEDAPVTPARLQQLAAFIAEHYDGLDGVRDGVIEDPLAVDFRPSRDLPKATAVEGGYTDRELAALDRIYDPVTAGGTEIFPRTVVGGEAPGLAYRDNTYEVIGLRSAWTTRVVPDEHGNISQRLILESWFRFVLFDDDDPQRDWRDLDPVRDLPAMDRAREVMDAVDPDLSRFQARGGRLILYHGWGDFGVNPLRTVQYVDAVRQRLGDRANEVVALYLVPGMFHCWGGVNVDRFDLMTPLIDWVEQDKPPGTVIGRRIEAGQVTRTRPLCRYPARSRYDGRGDPDQAQSFRCSP